MWATIGGIVQVVLFFIKMWGERDAERAKKKEEIAKEIVDAFQETDKAKQASKLNIAVGNINRFNRVR